MTKSRRFASFCRLAVEVKTSQLPVLTVDPNVHIGAFFTVILTVILNNTRQCFYQSKTFDSFWPVNVLTTFKVCLGKYINIFTDFDPYSSRRVKVSKNNIYYSNEVKGQRKFFDHFCMSSLV